MAEQEIAKHGKNVIHLMTKKEHTLAHRLREIAIEIATIVFAVSMSIWLHGLSEHHHQQQEVRSFLIGLRTDLKEDIVNLTNLKAGYRGFDENFAYLASLDPGKEPDWKKFEAAYEYMDANWFFIPNKSRFEGFMMSGKLNNIEDTTTLNRILNLYQSLLPQIRTSEGGWAGRQEKLRAYREDSLNGDDAREHFALVTSPKGKRMLTRMVASAQVYQRYQQYIDESERIVKAVDAAYPDLAATKAH
jgi:hypothetical protein